MTDCFEFLEKLAVEKENREGNRNDLFQKWIQLKSVRDKLLTKLDHLDRTENDLDKEIETELKDQGIESQGVHNQEIRERHQYLQDLLKVYRITGTHVCHEDKHQFTVCLDAAYYDTVVDSYLIEFKARENSYIINRHSLPEFIPTLRLEKEHLPHGDLSTFLSVIKNYLQDFVFKKEEVEKVKKFATENGLSCSAQYTSSYDFVEVELEDPNQVYRIKLVYGLMNVLPEKVQIEEDSETQQDIKQWKSVLLSKPLYDSFSQIVKDILD